MHLREIIKLLSVLVIVFLAQCAFSQSIPIIKAGSKDIKIIDGDDTLSGVLVPDLKLDIYPYHKSRQKKQVAYYTDIDSISFEVKPGDHYTFAIVLNRKDTCYQQITSINPNKVSYQSLGSNFLTPDTIPFILGPNNAIHIKGRMNNSDTLDLIFDTGASIGVLSDEGLEKDVKLDGGNKNQLKIYGITINNNPVTYIDYNGRLHADGVVGYNSFEDKVVEIDYDKNIMIIHDTVGNVKGYEALDIRWRASSMFIEGLVRIQNKEHKGLFLFDTGSKWALSLNKNFASRNRLYESTEKIGTRRAKGADGKTIKSNTVVLPELEIANLSLFDVPVDIELPSDGPGLAFNILGNDVLKRFNVILDLKQGVIYLQPNSLKNAPYNKSFDADHIIIAVSVFVGLLVIGITIYFRKKSKRNTQ